MSDTKQNGGKREGSGRKPLEPTKTIRIPVSLELIIKEIIESHKSSKN